MTTAPLLSHPRRRETRLRRTCTMSTSAVCPSRGASGRTSRQSAAETIALISSNIHHLSLRRFSSLVVKKGASWEKKQSVREELKKTKALAESIKTAAAEAKQKERVRVAEVRKMRQENERKSQTVQKVR